MVLGSQIQNLALFLSLCESFHPTRFRQRCGGFIPMVLFPIGFLRFRSRFETVRFLSRHLYEFAFSKSKKRFQTWTWDPGETGSDCTEHRIQNRLCPDFTPSIPDAEESRRRPFDFPEWIIDGILTRSFFGALIGYNNRLTKLVFKRCLFAVPHSTLDLPNIQIFRFSGKFHLFYFRTVNRRMEEAYLDFGEEVEVDGNTGTQLRDLLYNPLSVRTLTVCHSLFQLIQDSDDPVRLESEMETKQLVLKTNLEPCEFIGIRLMINSGPYLETCGDVYELHVLRFLIRYGRVFRQGRIPSDRRETSQESSNILTSMKRQDPESSSTTSSSHFQSKVILKAFWSLSSKLIANHKCVKERHNRLFHLLAWQTSERIAWLLSTLSSKLFQFPIFAYNGCFVLVLYFVNSF